MTQKVEILFIFRKFEKFKDWTNFPESRPLLQGNSFWAALPGAERRDCAQHPRGWFHMTRRAFLSSRVIQRQEKLRSKGLVKNYGKWLTKMKISQNPWIRFTSKQFSHLRQGKTYPGIHPLCLSMRFRKICTQGYVFMMTPKNWENQEIRENQRLDQFSGK